MCEWLSLCCQTLTRPPQAGCRANVSAGRPRSKLEVAPAAGTERDDDDDSSTTSLGDVGAAAALCGRSIGSAAAVHFAGRLGSPTGANRASLASFSIQLSIAVKTALCNSLCHSSLSPIEWIWGIGSSLMISALTALPTLTGIRPTLGSGSDGGGGDKARERPASGCP